MSEKINSSENPFADESFASSIEQPIGPPTIDDRVDPIVYCVFQAGISWAQTMQFPGTIDRGIDEQGFSFLTLRVKPIASSLFDLGTAAECTFTVRLLAGHRNIEYATRIPLPNIDEVITLDVHLDIDAVNDDDLSVRVKVWLDQLPVLRRGIT
jgi:hypothetical protein